MAMDPLTIARLALAGGQLAGGLIGMQDRDDDRRGQERIRRLLQQAQARNMRQGQAIAGSGAGISPALAQRAALDAVTRANEAATQSALDQESALALQDRQRADQLMGARLGALGAFGGQLLTALDDDSDDDTDSAGNVSKPDAVAAARQAVSSPASSPASGGVTSATPGAAAQAVVAAQQAADKPTPQFETDARGDVSQSALAQFLARGAGDEADAIGSDKQMLSLLENAYGQFDPNAAMVDGTAPTAEEFANTNLGLRTEDIPLGFNDRPAVDGEGDIQGLGAASRYEGGGGRTQRVDAEGNPITTQQTVRGIEDEAAIAQLTQPGGIAAAPTREQIRDRILQEEREAQMLAAEQAGVAFNQPVAPTNVREVPEHERGRLDAVRDPRMRPVPDVQSAVDNRLPGTEFGAPTGSDPREPGVRESRSTSTALRRRSPTFADDPAAPQEYVPKLTNEMQARIEREYRLGVDARQRELNRLQDLNRREERTDAELLAAVSGAPEEREEKLQQMAREAEEQAQIQQAQANAARRARAARAAEIVRRRQEEQAQAVVGGGVDNLQSVPRDPSEFEEGLTSVDPRTPNLTSLTGPLPDASLPPSGVPNTAQNAARITSRTVVGNIASRFGEEGAREMLQEPARFRSQLREMGVTEAQQRELEMSAASGIGDEPPKVAGAAFLRDLATMADELDTGKRRRVRSESRRERSRQAVSSAYDDIAGLR
jgi:hypothetical protein